MTAPERTPMTNDAERVSDIPRPVAYIVHEPTKFGGDHWFCDESDYATKVEAAIAGVRLTPLYTADIIEAQSKALAEAREALAMARERFDIIDCAGFTQNQQSTVEVLEYVKGLASDSSRRIRALTPTPENPNG